MKYDENLKNDGFAPNIRSLTFFEGMHRGVWFYPFGNGLETYESWAGLVSGSYKSGPRIRSGFLSVNMTQLESGSEPIFRLNRLDFESFLDSRLYIIKANKV